MDILISEEMDKGAIEELARRYEVVSDPTLWKNAARLRELIRSARVIIIRNQTQVTAELMGHAQHLIAIGRLGVGLDNIDLPEASKRKVVVIAPLDANATSVAELTLGLMLALARKIPRADRATKSGGWDRKGHTGLEMSGKTVAICGFGRIGRLTASRARTFGVRVKVYDPYVTDSAGIDVSFCKTLPEAVSEADFVAVHLPLTPETRHLFGAAIFGAMKRGAFFLNTSRGNIVDEASLLQALQSGHLGGAALDVREQEPPACPDPFALLENVILTPHIGSFTVEAQRRTFEAVCLDVDRVLRGEPAANFVNFASPHSF